ncbi:hypothetical protein HZR23_12685 [Serpentinicella alkaliphila]|nr:hypothetical protein HZR23_12685 [Serpentinicella alkaliphila]
MNVNREGVAFVANAEGYLALSRFFMYLSEIHMSIRKKTIDLNVNTVHGYGAYHFSDYVTQYAIYNKNYIFSPGPIENLGDEDTIHDLLFFISDKIGPEFWKDTNESSSTTDWYERSISSAFNKL